MQGIDKDGLVELLNRLDVSSPLLVVTGQEVMRIGIAPVEPDLRSESVHVLFREALGRFLLPPGPEKINRPVKGRAPCQQKTGGGQDGNPEKGFLKMPAANHSCFLSS